jgi:hypothetical protein
MINAMNEPNWSQLQAGEWPSAEGRAIALLRAPRRNYTRSATEERVQSKTDIAKVYVQRLGVMLAIALPVVALAAGLFDWILAHGNTSLVDSIISSVVFGYFVVGLWMVGIALIHTALTGPGTGFIGSFLLGSGLGAAARFFSARLHGLQFGAGAWRLPLLCALIGGLYGGLVAKGPKPPPPATN